MKVKELIEKLKKQNPNAIIEVEDCESRATVDGLEATFYNHPDNCYVVLKSALSYEQNEARKNQKKLDEAEMKLSKISSILGD